MHKILLFSNIFFSLNYFTVLVSFNSYALMLTFRTSYTVVCCSFCNKPRYCVSGSIWVEDFDCILNTTTIGRVIDFNSPRFDQIACPTHGTLPSSIHIGYLVAGLVGGRC